MQSLVGFSLLISALLPSSYAAATCPYSFKSPAPAGSSCGTQGSVSASALQSKVVTTFSTCRASCFANSACSAFSFAFSPSKGTEQCKLYSSAVSALGFTSGDTNTFFYDTACFNTCAFTTVTTTTTSVIRTTRTVTAKTIPASSGFLPVLSTAPQPTAAAGAAIKQNAVHGDDSQGFLIPREAQPKRMMQKREQTITRTATSVVSRTVTITSTVLPTAGGKLAACAANNFLGPNLPNGTYVNQAPPVKNPDGSPTVVNTLNATTQYDCCASCITTSDCAIFAFVTGGAYPFPNATNCANVIANACPNQSYVSDTYGANNDTSLPAVAIGNGYCGTWKNS